ncbi:MAG: hypothetical protein ACLPQY_24335 [Streptosporangiaceae bacterium]
MATQGSVAAHGREPFLRRAQQGAQLVQIVRCRAERAGLDQRVASAAGT